MMKTAARPLAPTPEPTVPAPTTPAAIPATKPPSDSANQSRLRDSRRYNLFLILSLATLFVVVIAGLVLL